MTEKPKNALYVVHKLFDLFEHLTIGKPSNYGDIECTPIAMARAWGIIDKHYAANIYEMEVNRVEVWKEDSLGKPYPVIKEVRIHNRHLGIFLNLVVDESKNA